MLDDLAPDELAMLGHALRMVPGNAVLTGKSAMALGGKGLAFFHEIDAYTRLWNKTALAVRERDDMARYRSAEAKW